MRIVLRKAAGDDLPAIVEILNHGIKTRHSVGYFVSQSVDEMKDWFEEHTGSERYPILVAEENKQITGWISLSPYRKGREAFNRTGEISAYIHEDYHRKGLGQMLLDAILVFSAENSFSIIFAIVLDRNTPSIKLLEKNGFERWAFLPEVAEIDGVLLNHIYFGKRL
ncbi:MAG: GNAT family N-acetyltransferase [Bacteroidetes bacterium]|nr:GNAT family N-acetyltransferase [Bacteroidota bacterium]